MKFTDKAIEIYTQHCKKKAVKINGIDHISIHDAINALSIASDGVSADVSGNFSADDMEEAYNDGAGINTPREFDINNYR